jgi:hypothetical protein
MTFVIVFVLFVIDGRDAFAYLCGSIKMNRIMKSNLLYMGILFLLAGCAKNTVADVITLETLLDEMVNVEELACFPDPSYICLQESSYDRRSVSPDSPGWFANSDGFGIVRADTAADGRIEKVMFDETGPGVITRIWITTLDKRGVWRFYFDGSETAGLTVLAYDLMQLHLPGLGKGLVQPHTSYTPEGKGGNTSFLPVPYSKACKITFEDAPGVAPTPKYYQINYRKYPGGTGIETFSTGVAQRAEKKISEVNDILLHPSVRKKGRLLAETKSIAPSDSLVITLPEGEHAVYEVLFDIETVDPGQYGPLMRELVFAAEFDGKQTVRAPLGDYSGGGMGAPRVDSWFLSSDGKGKVTSRWLMPYRKAARIKLLNSSAARIQASMQVRVAPLKWHERSLYFHASWKQENGIYLHHNPDEDARCVEWNFATLRGRGVYRGDVLSLFNHAPCWYGEGDEKIWVDGDAFPSHFGTGTEDYYNSSWAPVVPFHTPFGGAPRADTESSHGYNAFFRTRNLDGIPFHEQFRFDIEMLGWDSGFADYATTVYWYGDYAASATGIKEIFK